MLNVLKLDGTTHAPSQKLVQLYIATSGAAPSKSTKAVMLPATNAGGALKLLKYSKVKQYLDCSQAVLWRLQTAKNQLDWIKVSSIKDDYRYDALLDISHQLLDILRSSKLLAFSKTKSSKVIKEIVSAVYNMPNKQASDKDPFDYLLRLCIDSAYALDTNPTPPMSWYEMLSKSNQTTTNKNTVEMLNTIITDLTHRSLKVGVENDVEAEDRKAQVGKVSIGDKQWHYSLTPAHVILDLGYPNLKLQETLWRIKTEGQQEWTLFTANNLAKTETITQVLAQSGVEKCQEAIAENSLPNLAISTVYDNRADSSDEVITAFQSIQLEYHVSGGKWQRYNPVAMTTCGSVSDKARASYTLSRKEALEKYGHTGFMSAFMPPLNRYGEPLTTRYEFENWFNWCDQHQPKFETVAELEGKSAPTKTPVRKTKVVVLDAKVKRHMTEARQQELSAIYDTASLEFVKVWDKMEEMFNLDLPALALTKIFDTQNKFKEFYINPNGANSDHTHIEVNLGCTFNKVDLNDDAQRPTIQYTNPRFNIESVLTLNDFAKQKAIEIISEYLATNSSEFANALVCHEMIDQDLIGKKKALANMLVSLLSK